MPVLVYIGFDFSTEKMKNNFYNHSKEMTDPIKNEPGFISELWTSDTNTEKDGYIYIFQDHKNAILYIEKHKQQMSSLNAKNIVYKIFDINARLSHKNYKYLQ